MPTKNPKKKGNEKEIGRCLVFLAAARNSLVQRKLQLSFEIRKGLKFYSRVAVSGDKVQSHTSPRQGQDGQSKTAAQNWDRCNELAWGELQHPFSQGLTLEQPILLHFGDAGTKAVLTVISIAF